MYPNRMFWFVTNQVAGRTRLGATQASASDACGLADDPPQSPNDPTIQGHNSKTQFLFQEFQATLSSSNPSEAASVCRVPKSTTIRPPKRPKKYWNNTPKFQQVPHESSVVNWATLAVSRTRVTSQLLNGFVQKWGTQKSQRLIIFLIKNDRFGVYPQCWANWEAHPSMPHMSSVKTYWKIEFHVWLMGIPTIDWLFMVIPNTLGRISNFKC